MKYRIVFDNHNLITFEEWPAAIVCFYNKITTSINDVIEFYEHDIIILTWVKGKGLIHKKTKPVISPEINAGTKKEPLERPLNVQLL